jgi:predicted PurR-regulated permease PerM
MEKKLKPIFFLFLFIVVIGLNIYLFHTLFHTLAFATIIAGAFYPIFSYLYTVKKIKKNIAALIVTLCVLLTIVLPSIYLIGQLSKESLSFYKSISGEFTKDVVKNHLLGEGTIATSIDSILGTLEVDMTKEELYKSMLEKSRNYFGSFLKVFNSLISDAIKLLFQFIMVLLAIYAIFMTGDQLKEYIFKLSPLPEDQEQKILDRYNQMNYVTLVGNGIGGVIQGVLAGIAFWLCGLPSVFLWTTIMIILAFIPLVGMSFVFIPASLYLILSGKVMTGILLFVWCGIVSLVVENIYKPKFVGDRLQVNGILLLFYIIAGMSVFGAAGLFYGPILCIIFLTISELFTTYYLNEKSYL